MNIRWGRVIVLALALEVVLFATLLPIQPLMSPRAWLVAVGIGAVPLFVLINVGKIAASTAGGATSKP